MADRLRFASVATVLDLSDLPAGVQYVTRDAWGLTDAEAKRRGLNIQPNGAPELYWHHTAGSFPNFTTATWDDDPIRYIQWHDEIARNGGLNTVYRAVAYSWLIHKAPRNKVTIIEGRGDIFPAATRGRNTVSKAICFVGNFASQGGPRPVRSPRQSELDAGRWLRSALIRAGVVLPGVEGLGHHENPSCKGCSTCPGDLMIPHLGYLNTDWEFATPKPPPPIPTTGVIPEMYLFKYRKPGWPGEFIARVTANRIDHAQNGDATKVDEAAGVPVFEATKKEQVVALLSDKGRTHHGTSNPFVGPYADDDLHGLW